jgi:hypothetical protein
MWGRIPSVRSIYPGRDYGERLPPHQVTDERTPTPNEAVNRQQKTRILQPGGTAPTPIFLATGHH